MLKHCQLFFASSVLFALFLQTSCSTPPLESPVTDPESVWAERQQQLARIQYWYLNGRVAVNNGTEAWHLDMDWSQQGQDYQMQLSGPFGAGRVKLAGNASGVLLTNADDQAFYADSAEKLLYEITGVSMPVDEMRYWIVGLAGPGQTGKTQLDQQGRLAAVEDTRWKVRFRGYMAVNGVDLPRKIFIDRADRQIDVRLVVDNWKLGVH